ncbi:leucine-rich repeat extensin-like protein 5 [Gossypium raimondii]|uniref:leucine-rich repeat extensin-like protein 5 n=1 Tax=Gossypium raimondii TaxID=29730 RepID=UPI00227B01C0|nr:leucine-rich repeat extensin-like protein 5 [Gossypium raimondii]
MEHRIWIFLLYSTMAATLFIHCDARKPIGLVKDLKHGRNSMTKHTNRLQLMSKLMSLVIQPTDVSNTQPYRVSSPFSLPPFDSLPPVNYPPYCSPPNAPASTLPTPIGMSTPSFPPTLPGLSPPPSTTGTSLSPPEFSITPNTPQAIPTPTIYEPSPPAIVISPPFYVPSPIGFNPSPPVFLPPIVYPPPTGPPPPNVAPSTALWCVAKPSVPDPIIQEAMNYACGSGADCNSIQPSGSCFHPDTLYAHASYAFNSYWQRTKYSGGTCEFGGTAILVTVDPSYDACHFEYD